MFARATDIQEDGGASGGASEIHVRAPGLSFICHKLTHSL